MLPIIRSAPRNQLHPLFPLAEQKIQLLSRRILSKQPSRMHHYSPDTQKKDLRTARILTTTLLSGIILSSVWPNISQKLRMDLPQKSRANSATMAPIVPQRGSRDSETGPKYDSDK